MRTRSIGRAEEAERRALSPSKAPADNESMSPQSRRRNTTATARTSSNPDNIMMLFDKICSDYFMARHAGNDSGRHILQSSLTKLCKVINHQQVSDKMLERIRVYCDTLVVEAQRKEVDMQKASKDDIAIEMALREWMKPKFLHLLEEMRLEFELKYTDASPEVGKEVAAMGEIRIEGYLRKKGQHVNLWRERYFMIRSSPNGTHILCYFRKKGDRDPRGWYVLGPGCTVDEVRESPSLMESKKLFTFRIRHYSNKLAEESGDEQEAPHTPSTATASDGFDFNFDPKANIKKARMKKMAVAATAATAATATLVLTGGLAGIGMVGVGAAAFSSAAITASAGSYLSKTYTAPIALAAESLETAIWWRNCLLECIAQAETSWRKYVQWYLAHEKDDDGVLVDEYSAAAANATSSDADVNVPAPRRLRAASLGAIPRTMAKSLRWYRGLQNSWSFYTQTSNLRIHNVPQSPTPVLKASLSIPASADAVFEMLHQLDSPFYKTNNVLQAAKMVASVDRHTDVVHWELQPIYLWPVVVEQRDFCLMRYWRRLTNGSYVVWMHSTTYKDCPSGKCIRGDLKGGGFVITPPRSDADDTSCLVTFVVQMNPRGWLDSTIATHLSYFQSYHVALLDMLVDLKAAFHASTYLRVKAFKSTAKKTAQPPRLTEDVLLQPFKNGIECRNVLSDKYWAEPAGSNYMVRSSQYLVDKSKQPSERQIFRLLGVELYRFDEVKKMGAIGLKSLSSNRPEDSFYFVVNLLLPPGYSLVLYFTPEERDFLQEGSAWAELCADFFDGEDPSFRSKRLKLIPRVVEGNWVVREGVGSTPTILGTKMTHRYYRGDQFCEVDFYVGSSSVASGLVRLLLGHAPDLVLDLGFVLEGATADELPERLLGSVRLRHLDIANLATPFPFAK
ncbi:unnamed protein product [Aphanomyces euteiches]